MNGRHRALFADEGDASVGTVAGPELEREPPLPVRAVRGLLRPRSIKAKLSRILLVSLVLVLAAIALIATGKLRDFRSSATTTRVVTVALSVQDLVHNLQKERGLTNGMLGGGTQFQPQVVAVRPRTDSTLAALHKLINSKAYAGATATEVGAALGILDQLGSVRHGLDTRVLSADAVFAYYTNAIATLNGRYLGLDQTKDANLRHGLQALYALGDAKEYTGQERGLLNGVFSGAPFPIDQYVHFTEIRANKQDALTFYGHFATPDERSALDIVRHSPAATEAATFESIAVAGVNGSLPQHVGAQAWWDQMTSVINDMRGVQQSVGADITNRARYLQNLALRELIAYLVAAAIAIGIEMALVIGALRSIIGPLGVLAGDADDVSKHRLPEAVEALENTDDDVEMPKPVPILVPLHSGTEIRRMARALNRLQQAALSLAGEQAMIRRNTTVSLANLGRRNQNLVRRQLSLISEFEREELDPSTLANMFELDHLATRMRRNAENLLVLVGESGSRSWSKPMPIVEVARAALSEVEDYRRVGLKRIDDVLIAGSAVTEVAHMLAELLDNGLAFSPPDVEVEIYGRKVGNRYTIAVVDHGSGMQPDALVEANARLHDEENYLVAPTRFLGHYVVGRLARQLGIEVHLAPAPITGVTARVVLPPELLSDTAERPTKNNGASVAPPVAECRPEPEIGPEPRVLPAINISPPTPPVRVRSDLTEALLLQPLPLEQSRPAQQGQPAARTQPAAQAPNNRVRVDVRGERERTRNGLVKRQARAVRPRPQAATRPLTTAANRPASETAVRDRMPSDISSLLSSYRAGHQRGGPAPDRPMPPPGRRPAGEAGRPVPEGVARPTYPTPRRLHVDSATPPDRRPGNVEKPTGEPGHWLSNAGPRLGDVEQQPVVAEPTWPELSSVESGVESESPPTRHEPDTTALDAALPTTELVSQGGQP